MHDKIEILIVEDSPTQALQLQFLLECEGYGATVAQNGKQALELLADRFFPIIITDWVMPEMDGLEFCRELRQRYQDDYIYVFLVTARSSKEEIVKGLESGADDYLVKPVEPAELVARLSTARRVLGLEHTLKERNQEISRLLYTDHLTQVYNRSYLDETLEIACKQAARYHRALAVAICDIDHFKKVNDIHGHQIGDKVLMEVARVLRETVRIDLDWVARYGGEEFVLVLPETGLEGAVQVCQRLRRLVAGCRFADGQDGFFSITLSFGVAVLAAERPENSANPAAYDMIGLADNCLYQAKGAGRDRVIASCFDRKAEA